MQIRSLARVRARARLWPALGALASVVLANCAELPTTPPTTPALAPPETPLENWQAVVPWPPLNTEYTWVKGQSAVYLGSNYGRACFLTGIGGRFNGSSDWVGVYNTFGGWYLSGASSGSGSYAVSARARCVAASSYSPEETATVLADDDPTNGVSLGGGACGLTRIGGKLALEHDYASISWNPSSSSWTLIVNSASQEDLSARARCITAPATVVVGAGTWAYPDPILSLASAGVSLSDFCLLTQVHGPFRAIADWVWLRKSSSQWSILGADQSDIGACADCFRP